METFEKLVKRNYHLSCKELDDFFATLEPININMLTNEWKVEYLFTKEGTGSYWEIITKTIPFFRVYSKQFLNKNNVNAWVYKFFGIKFHCGIAKAFLKEITFRNKKSVSMIYKNMQMIDHFRKIDENTIMGIMETNNQLNLYFYLKK